MEKDMETGPRGDGGRGKSRTRKKEKKKKGPRGIEGLGEVEMGPAAMRSVQENLASRPPPTRSGDGIGVGRNDQALGTDRIGGQYQMAGALQGDDIMQQAPVGQRPFLPPNQQFLPRTEPRRVDLDPGAPPPGRSIRSEARRADRARPSGEGRIANGIGDDAVSKLRVPSTPSLYERLVLKSNSTTT